MRENARDVWNSKGIECEGTNEGEKRVKYDAVYEDSDRE